MRLFLFHIISLYCSSWTGCDWLNLCLLLGRSNYDFNAIFIDPILIEIMWHLLASWNQLFFSLLLFVNERFSSSCLFSIYCRLNLRIFWFMMRRSKCMELILRNIKFKSVYYELCVHQSKRFIEWLRDHKWKLRHFLWFCIKYKMHIKAKANTLFQSNCSLDMLFLWLFCFDEWMTIEVCFLWFYGAD